MSKVHYLNSHLHKFREKSKNPWDSVMQQTECNKCKMIIPNHLGERWDGISYEKAKNEWKNFYKKNSKKQKF